VDEALLAAAAGLAAGVAHVLSGPDHLAAVLPFTLRDRWGALRAGALWGLGHGFGVSILAALMVVLRELIDLEALSRGAELIVGVSLIAVGAWSIRQSRVMVVHSHTHDHGHGAHSHVHLHFRARATRPQVHDKPGAHARHPHAMLAFGVLHGVAGASHLFGLLPSFALGRAAAIVYLVAFLGGGLAAMAAFAFAAGRLITKDAWLPRALAFAGVASICVGGAWIFSFAA
jgi:hypothetical protein